MAFSERRERTQLIVSEGHAADYTQGAFREYLLTEADLVMRIPAHISFIQASTIGMGISTASQALYQSLLLPLPEVDPRAVGKTILIYGGSTATGSLAIQLAKLYVVFVLERRASLLTTPDPGIESSPPALQITRSGCTHCKRTRSSTTPTQTLSHQSVIPLDLQD